MFTSISPLLHRVPSFSVYYEVPDLQLSGITFQYGMWVSGIDWQNFFWLLIQVRGNPQFIWTETSSGGSSFVYLVWGLATPKIVVAAGDKFEVCVYDRQHSYFYNGMACCNREMVRVLIRVRASDSWCASHLISGHLLTCGLCSSSIWSSIWMER